MDRSLHQASLVESGAGSAELAATLRRILFRAVSILNLIVEAVVRRFAGANECEAAFFAVLDLGFWRPSFTPFIASGYGILALKSTTTTASLNNPPSHSQVVGANRQWCECCHYLRNPQIWGYHSLS